MLFCYLGLFTWNARTGFLDTATENSGLEIVSYILSPVTWVKDSTSEVWNHYLALTDVAKENDRLKEELDRAKALATLTVEERSELTRLRALLRLQTLTTNPAFGARIIAKRFGPQSVLKTFTINKGYLDGALAGTPVLTQSGVVGRILRAGPHAATVLMLTDSSFKLAVIGQKHRTPGIISGSASGDSTLSVAYVPHNQTVEVGEVLVTAGVDGEFPKGIPVGVVTEVTTGNDPLFQQIKATSCVDLSVLEEVLVLQPEGSGPPLLERLPDPVQPAPSDDGAALSPVPATGNTPADNP